MVPLSTEVRDERSLTDSYAYAARITKAEAKNFYYTFGFLPPERRRSVFAVYAFSRRADDAVDAVEERGGTPTEARADLNGLRQLLDSAAVTDDPLRAALADTIRRYEIPTVLFEELLLGMEMDLEKKRYATFTELEGYCYRAASVVGLICVRIFGLARRDAAYEDCRDAAVALGLAMQLTNILRDVAEDCTRGRIYLPAEDLRRFGCSEDDLFSSKLTPEFRALMKFEVDRTRELFRRAEPLYPEIHPDSRYCPVLLMRFYSRILDRIERAEFDVFSRRPSLPRREKIALVAQAWLESRRFIQPRF